MEAFRIKETKEFMSVDEMKDKCDATEKIMTVLEVNLSFIIIYGIRSVIDGKPLILMR